MAPARSVALAGLVLACVAALCSAQMCIRGNETTSLFCTPSLMYNVSKSTQFVVQDSIAKQTVDIVLNQIINSKGVFVTADCANKFRAYACAVNFPKCLSDGSFQRPCKSMCTDYCDACFVSTCPCSDMPETGCFTFQAPGVDTADNGASSVTGVLLTVAAAAVAVVGGWRAQL